MLVNVYVYSLLSVFRVKQQFSNTLTLTGTLFIFWKWNNFSNIQACFIRHQIPTLFRSGLSEPCSRWAVLSLPEGWNGTCRRSCDVQRAADCQCWLMLLCNNSGRIWRYTWWLHLFGFSQETSILVKITTSLLMGSGGKSEAWKEKKHWLPRFVH